MWSALLSVGLSAVAVMKRGAAVLPVATVGQAKKRQRAPQIDRRDLAERVERWMEEHAYPRFPAKTIVCRKVDGKTLRDNVTEILSNHPQVTPTEKQKLLAMFEATENPFGGIEIKAPDAVMSDALVSALAMVTTADNKKRDGEPFAIHLQHGKALNPKELYRDKHVCVRA